jgi:hypothetical protein
LPAKEISLRAIVFDGASARETSLIEIVKVCLSFCVPLHFADEQTRKPFIVSFLVRVKGVGTGTKVSSEFGGIGRATSITVTRRGYSKILPFISKNIFEKRFKIF